jgi:Leucine-rich repeat (LRR) protein
MFVKTPEDRQKDLIKWAKKYEIDLPNKPEELQNVTILDIGRRGIERLPKEIDCLPNLEELFACNNLMSELPWEFAHLKKLRVLDLGFNKFFDITGVICQLPQLESLYLEGNCIKKLTHVIANLIALKELNLFFNQIAELPIEFCSLRHLAKLNLAANELQGLPDHFTKLYNLVELDLWMNKFDQVPDLIKEMPNVKKVNMEANMGIINHQLIIASMYNNVQLAERLVSVGADVNYKLEDFDPHPFTTPLFEAKSVDMVRLLLSNGADPNLQREAIKQGSIFGWGGGTVNESFLTKKHSPEVTKFLKTLNL